MHGLSFSKILGVLLLGAGVAWAEDDALVVTDDVTIPEEGAAYSSITFNASAKISGGPITLGADESFPNVRTVRVSGGTLALTSAGQLDRRVNLYVSGSGKISIPDGVTLEVRRLYVNGVSQKMGDYTEGVVTGGGKVHVPGGAAVILR